jgi:hypothetical protein
VLPELDDITRRVLDRAASGEELDPFGVIFLIRQYRATGREDVSAVLEPALGRALASHAAADTTLARATWLHVFTEAATLSADGRLVDAAHALVTSLSEEWPQSTFVDETAASIDACLAASQLVDPAEIVAAAIDALEHVVGRSYRPGDGVAHRIERGGDGRGELADHVRLAAALLTGFEITGRLPYSMLAEELMETSRESRARSLDFAPCCEAARVLCRLAALHGDAEYRAAAVISDADHRADAEQILGRLGAAPTDETTNVALYGIALTEYHQLVSG